MAEILEESTEPDVPDWEYELDPQTKAPKKLGRGSFGDVYGAVNKQTHQLVRRSKAAGSPHGHCELGSFWA